MTLRELRETAHAMVAPGKGILAMDESTPTCDGRFQPLGIATTEENRRAYRELLATAPGLSEYISGAILYDETLRQKISDGRSFPQCLAEQGILPGIKVDTGAKALAGHPGEKVTEGLDGLRERLAEYRELGARFAKWRAVITIGDGGLPSRAAIEANAHALARYAALCQEAGLVPIVEPEVLMTGEHSIERCSEVSEETLRTVFYELGRQAVALEGIVLKPNMVISALESSNRAGVQQVAEATVRCLAATVPSAVPGIAFLSGGQGDEEATAHLDAMNRLSDRHPWALTFSYGRALQRRALETWGGEASNVPEAQKALLHRARLNGAGALGRYAEDMEQNMA